LSTSREFWCKFFRPQRPVEPPHFTIFIRGW
jgi:hypothetical protein